MSFPDSELLRLLPQYLDVERLSADHPDYTAEMARKVLEELIEASVDHSPLQKEEDASAQAADSVLIFTDGGSRGNPGPAGIGVVVLSGEETLVEVGESIGEATNNEAEYRALIRGLEESKRVGARRVDIRMDSQLIVRQVEGRYKVKHPVLKGHYAQVMLLLNGFDSWKVLHIPREMNARADALANLGMDSA
ncbi:MAG: ribonuclease HI family protein [Planctomycetota bacterium]|jgi:ribonuclease HI|nr:ribonuclease HI family protein [Planctomycetota bacterium]